MLKFNERPANQVQNPESPDKVLFLNPDGVLQLKDSAGTLTNLVAENATGQSTARPFKVYKALLTQSGTAAPVATVIENTLGGTVVWSRDSAGVYYGTLVGAFPDPAKINLPQSGILKGDPTLTYEVMYDSSDAIVINSFNSSSTDDNVIKPLGILTIEVYP